MGGFSDQRTHNFGPRIGPLREDRMGRNHHTPKQIAAALRQLESCVCREVSFKLEVVQ